MGGISNWMLCYAMLYLISHLQASLIKAQFENGALPFSSCFIVSGPRSSNFLFDLIFKVAHVSD
jgi:hypothetical protein